MRKRGCDVIKSIIIIVLILLAALVSAYTPEQQTTIDGMNLSYQLCIAYEKASQGQNVTEFNTLVDIYNAWIREHFGEDVNLLMQKMNDTTQLEVSTEISDNRSLPVPPRPFSRRARIERPFQTRQRALPIWKTEGNMTSDSVKRWIVSTIINTQNGSFYAASI